MLAALAVVVLGPPPAEGIAEYFPLNVGDTWSYTDKNDSITARTVDTVGEPIEIGGLPAFPVISSQDGKEYDRAYYRVSEGTVEVVSFIKDKPLLAPYPVLQSPELGGKWSHTGETYMQGEPADLKLEGSVRRVAAVEFQGKKYEALEVRLEGTILEEFGTKVTFTQVATYGKGVGLIKFESTTRLPKRTVKGSRTLTAYKPAKT